MYGRIAQVKQRAEYDSTVSIGKKFTPSWDLTVSARSIHRGRQCEETWEIDERRISADICRVCVKRYFEVLIGNYVLCTVLVVNTR